MTPFKIIGASFLLCAMLTPSCASATTTGQLRSQIGQQPKATEVAESWYPLIRRLTESGVYGADVEQALLAIGPLPSQDPMGRKITELYKRAFVPRAPVDPSLPRPKPRTVYEGHVTEENLQKCRVFMAANKQALEMGRTRYGVPPEVAVSLLFVETRLGGFMGKEKAFLTLASMAASREPSQINDYLAPLPNTDANTGWIAEKMRQRSDRAYKELVAFIQFTRAARIDPLSVPGSIYGAIGLCQFMPSNLESLGADGNGDGVVNLFEAPDAIASLGNYLAKHGWKSTASRDIKIKVIKRYNNYFVYANTILTMAEALSKPQNAAAKPAAKPTSAGKKQAASAGKK